MNSAEFLSQTLSSLKVCDREKGVAGRKRLLTSSLMQKENAEPDRTRLNKKKMHFNVKLHIHTYSHSMPLPKKGDIHNELL